MLYEYLQIAQRLLGFDSRQSDFNLADLTFFINQARRQVAAQGECLRWQTPANGPLLSPGGITVTAGGSGYTSPTVVITPPDAPSGQLPYPQGKQATATATLSGGAVASVTITDPGSGYFAPQAHITDPTGSGATLSVATVASVNRTNTGQEIYNFSDIDLTPDSGASAILSLRGITIIWGTWQYELRALSYSRYMQTVRLYSRGYLGQPVAWCQFGQGEAGTVRMFPVPDQEYPMQWDCQVLPTDLIDDDTTEPIPPPWRDAVPIYAAYLAILGRSYDRPALAPLADKYYNPKDGGLFGDMMRRARHHAQPQQTRRVNY